jgi:Nuclease-related domain
MGRTGLPVPHDRRLREGSDANIDHLVVAADAVYVVDAKNLAGSLTTAGDQLRIDGRDRAKTSADTADIACQAHRLWPGGLGRRTLIAYLMPTG